MELRYLDFDYSEDAEGNGVFDAMACVAPSQHGGVLAEVVAVLGWAHATFPGACAPAEDGGLWHYELRGAREVTTPEVLDFDERTGRLAVHAEAPAPARHTVILSLAGTAAVCEAFRLQFDMG
ncbi:MAG: hypothetical protein V4505_04130 [Pseudomonadota bacterium]